MVNMRWRAAKEESIEKRVQSKGGREEGTDRKKERQTENGKMSGGRFIFRRESAGMLRKG
jgi:hypothetical protein